jgi:hypothetical protein
MIEAEIQRKIDAARRSLGEALDLCSVFTKRNHNSPKVAAAKKTRREIGKMMDALRSLRGMRQLVDMSDPDMMSEDERAMQARQKREEERRQQEEKRRQQAQ